MKTSKTKPALRTMLMGIALSGIFITTTQADLVGLWRFDDATLGRDSSAQGNHLTAYNDAAQSTGSQGRYGEGLSLDGDNDWLGMAGDTGGDNPGVPANIPLAGSSYTLSAWIKPGVAAAGNAGIIGWGNYGTPTEVNAFRLDSDDGLVNYWWANDLSNPNTGTLFTDGNWHHVAATYDASAVGNDHFLFVNGVQVAQRDSNNAINALAENFRIGQARDLGEDWLGMLDDVAVFDEALTLGQLQTIAAGDFSAFGVIPEPSTLALVLVGLSVLRFRGHFLRNQRRPA